MLPAHHTTWVKPDVQPRVRHACNAMLNSNATAIDQGEGMVEYKLAGESEFSFLMRDEKLPD